MKFRVLSIDWDYFFECSEEDRNILFPNGGREDLPREVKNVIWSSYYANYPDLKKRVKLNKKALEKLYKVLDHVKHNNVTGMISESHKDIYDFILKYTHTFTPIEIHHLDHHHDVFQLTRNNSVNCGNWLRMLFNSEDEKNARKSVECWWCKNNDSDIRTLGVDNVFEEFPYLHDTPIEELFSEEKLKDPTNFKYDLIFLCRSDIWSPPHLDKHFRELEDKVIDTCNICYTLIDEEILAPRKIQKLVQQELCLKKAFEIANKK